MDENAVYSVNIFIVLPFMRLPRPTATARPINPPQTMKALLY